MKYQVTYHIPKELFKCKPDNGVLYKLLFLIA